MFKKNSLRQKSFLKYSLLDHFLEYKWSYIIFGIIVLLGLLLGFFIGFNRAENFSLNDLPDMVLAQYISKKASIAAVFFSRLFGFLGLCLLLICLNSKGFLCPLSFFVLLYRSFLVGINSAILISLYKFGGVVNVVLIYLPVHLTSLILLMILGAICFWICVNSKKMCCSVFSFQFLKGYKNLFLILFLLAFVCFLLEAIVMPHITATLFLGVE